MKSLNYNVVIKSLVTAGALAVTLTACTKGAQNNRLGMNTTPVNTNVAPNGVNANNNLPACNPNDANPADLASPCNRQSSCTNLSLPMCTNAVSVVNNQQNSGGPFANQPQQNGQQQYVNNNGQVVGPNYGMPPSSNDFGTDLNAAGRIVNKQFQLAAGQAVQEASDNCAINEENLDALDQSKINTVGGVHTYQWGRPLYPVNSPPAIAAQRVNSQFIPDRFDLNFKADGSLIISAQSEIGNAAVTQPITPVDFDPSNPPGTGTYALDPETRTLNVGPFDMYGPVSEIFKQHEQFLAMVLRHQSNVDEYDSLDLNGPLPSDMDQDFSNPSGQRTFVIGHSNNSSSQNSPTGANYTFRPQNLGHPHSNSPNYLSLSVNGLVAQMALLLPANPQHITGLLAKEIQMTGTTYIDTTKGANLCNGDAHIKYLNVFLK